MTTSGKGGALSMDLGANGKRIYNLKFEISKRGNAMGGDVETKELFT
jgi:hypothetical protein